MSEKIIAVDRALEILLYLRDRGEEMGISEISRDLDLPKSAVHRTLTTMEEKNFVYKNPHSEHYWLGTQLFSLGSAVKEKISIIDIVQPYTENLYEKTGEVINVSILEQDETGVYKTMMVYKKSGDRNVLSVNPRLGSVLDAYCSAVGKALLAFTPGVDLDIYNTYPMVKFTEKTLTDLNLLQKELEQAKQQGYAVDNEEQEIGLYCIGAPILNSRGEALAAISVSGPTARMKNDALPEKIRLLKETVEAINRITRHM